MSLEWTDKRDGIDDVMANDVNNLAKAIMESDTNIGQLNITIENLNQQTSGNSQDIQNIVTEQNQINADVENRLNELEQGGSVDLSDYYDKNETDKRLEKKVDKINGWDLAAYVGVSVQKSGYEATNMGFKTGSEPWDIHSDWYYPVSSVDAMVKKKNDEVKNEAITKAESIKDGIDEKLDKKLNKEVYYYGSHLIHEMDKKYFIFDDTEMVLQGINIPEDEPFPTQIIIPCGIVGIMNDVFKDCVELEGVIIPKSVSYIGSDAFSGCDNLVSVSFGGSKAEWEEIQILPGNDALINAHDLSYGDSSVSESFVLNLFSQAANPDDFYTKATIDSKIDSLNAEIDDNKEGLAYLNANKADRGHVEEQLNLKIDESEVARMFDEQLGDIDSALDEIIALQVAKGGDSK